MNSVRLIAIAVVCAFLLSSCHPTYTRQQVAHYARKVGVVGQFEINRINNRVFAFNNRLFIVSEQHKAVDMRALSKVVANGLSPFFSQVVPADNAASIGSAAAIAAHNRADFALYIRLTEGRSLFNENEPTPATDYRRLQMLIIIVDANSAKVVEKIQLLARPSLVALTGSDMATLLAKPLERIGQDLSGVL